MNTEAGAGGRGGSPGRGNNQSREPSAAGDSSAMNTEAGAGGRGGSPGRGNSPAPSAGNHSNDVILVSGDSSEEDNSDLEIVEPGAGKHGSEGCGRDHACNKKRKTERNRRLCLFDPNRDGNAHRDLPLLVTDVSGGTTITIEVELEDLDLYDLHFKWKQTEIDCEFGDATTKNFTIAAKDGARFQDGLSYVRVLQKTTGMIIGTVCVRKHT